MTHLRYAAQFNDDVAERDQSEGSDPPSNSLGLQYRQRFELHALAKAMPRAENTYSRVQVKQSISTFNLAYKALILS